jgi:hypothetical protein
MVTSPAIISLGQDTAPNVTIFVYSRVSAPAIISLGQDTAPAHHSIDNHIVTLTFSTHAASQYVARRQS